MRFLLVEDNITIAKGLIYSLEKEGNEVVHCDLCSKAVNLISKDTAFDLVILDVALPDGNGFRLYESTIGPTGLSTIFLTAKDEEDDIVKGLDLGAEDYITKPFSSKELMARVKRIMLRQKKQTLLVAGDLSFDMDKMVVYKAGKEVLLSSLELKLVNLLFLNLNKVVSRNTILDKIWEWTGNFVDDHTVTVYFKRIREKLDTEAIKTVKGVGYRLDV